MKIWKLLPAAALALGAAGVVPATAASASPSPQLPAGVSESGALHYAPAIAARIPKNDLPDAHGPAAAAGTANGTLFSGNWAGYVDLPLKGSGNYLFKSATFSFVMPTLTAEEKSNCVTAANEDSFGESYAYYWVGLDGWKDSTVEQDGAATWCQPNGTVSDFAWWETYPGPPVTFTGANPGNHITVSVTYTSAHKYDMVFHDTTNGGSFNANEPCESGNTCLKNSAEYITEDPGGGPGGGVYLADYGAVSYTGAKSASPGVSGPISKTSEWSGWRIDEEYNNSIMQNTRSLNSAGNAFTDDFNAPY